MMRILIAMLLGAGAAHAGTFKPPEGCTAHLTVQLQSCVVVHYWTCIGNEPGAQWSGEMSQEGLVYVGQIDNEAQWIKSFYLRTAEEETLISPAEDPASLTSLLATGLDTYDFTLDTTNGINRVVGFDRIVERDVVIDGETMHRTEFNIRTTNVDGDLIFAAEGSEYVSPTYRRFFSGYGTITGPDAPYTYDDSPVNFIHRGEKGFLSDTPVYNCAAITARFDLQ